MIFGRYQGTHLRYIYGRKEGGAEGCKWCHACDATVSGESVSPGLRKRAITTRCLKESNRREAVKAIELQVLERMHCVGKIEPLNWNP